MKANDAPEKIYLHPNLDSIFGMAERSCESEIEYTRTDAFIEKVLDYIENNIYDYYDGDHEYGVCGGFVKKEEFIKNIKDYMKGE